MPRVPPALPARPARPARPACPAWPACRACPACRARPARPARAALSGARALKCLAALATLAALAALTAACGGSGASDETGAGGAAADRGAAAGAWFVERAHETGLDFVHFNGASGGFYYPEILGPGVALFDYDNDGDLDVYVVQGHMLGRDPDLSRALIAPRDPTRLTGRLFRNDLRHEGGAPILRFTDVTEESGIVASQFGLGVATADVNNDGWVDLLLLNFGTPRLLLNQGDGSFRDVSAESGLPRDPAVIVSAAFFDYDRDGWLDLYLAYNVHYTLENERACPNAAGVRDYCPPQIYGGVPDRLLRNTGGGRFVGVSRSALVGGTYGPALGVIAGDFNGDGWLDLFVANDGEPDMLWINHQDGTFRETGLLSGVALTGEGRAEASMGVGAADVDADGDEDLVVTELTSQGTNLYVNDGDGRFRDVSAPSGVGPMSLQYTGWGTAFIDVDNDGRLDLFAVNGTILAAENAGDEPFPYGQRKLLFRNSGGGRFEDVTGQAGPALAERHSGRGAAFGDVDNDGDIDIVVGNDTGPIQVLVNEIGSERPWIGLRVVSRHGRDALGARVVVMREDGSTLVRRVRTDGSYASAQDPRLVIGLGEAAASPDVEVHWVGGEVERWTSVPIGRWATLTEGEGVRSGAR